MSGLTRRARILSSLAMVFLFQAFVAGSFVAYFVWRFVTGIFR